MVKKKNKPAAATAKKTSARKNSFDPDSFKYYFPVLLAVMIVGIVILFKDFLFSNNMLYGSDTINAGLFFRHFYVDYVHSFGSVPLWNPYIFGGLPFIDAFHGDIFYGPSISPGAVDVVGVGPGLYVFRIFDFSGGTGARW